jgi:hypothetical protein
MIDNKAPVLKRFSLPSVIDIGKGAQALRIEAEGDDEGGSGLFTVSVWLDKELDLADGGRQLLQFGYPFLPGGFGDDTPTTAFESYTVREQTPIRSYTVTGVWLTDQAGNVAKYDTEQLKALGMNTALSVVGRPADLTPPVLTKLSLPASVDLSAGPVRLPVQVEASDGDGDGARMVTVWLNQALAADGRSHAALSIGNGLGDDDFRDATPHTASKSFILDSSTVPGTYNITSVAIEDRAGNMREFDRDYLKAIGASTSITVTGAVGDTSPPLLLDLWLPRAVSVKPGAQNAFAARAGDWVGGKGVSSVIAFFDRELTFSRGASSSIYLSTFGDGDRFADATPDFAVERFKLTEATAPGTYHLTSVLVTDQAGNHASYTAQQLQQLGVNTAMTVVDTPATAVARPFIVNGQLRIALSSSDWAAGGSDAFAVTLTYDAAKLGLISAAVLGATGSSVATSLTQPGRVTVTGSGELPPDAILELVLYPVGGTAPFEYAIENFTVNGRAQVFGAGNLEIVRFGTAGADVLTDTVLTGLIDGLGGLDKAVFAGNRDSYTVTKSGAGFVVASDGGERISLVGIERLSFNGEQFGLGLALDLDGVGGQAYRLYQAAFDRSPDAAGVGFWMRQMDAGMSLASVARSFLQSREFESKYGVDPSDEAFLTALYGNVLHRAADADGYAFWLKALRADFDRAELLALFSESPENVAQVIGSIENGFSYYT